MTIKVMNEQCSSCIFGPDSSIGAERFRELRARWRALGAEAAQVCHQSKVAEDDEEIDLTADDVVICRGYFDDEYVKRGTACAALQVAERLGYLTFVDGAPEA